MADSRRAKDDIALDVDMMAIDYILYKAIEAQIRSLANDIQYLTEELNLESEPRAHQSEADKLIEILDSLIHFFRLNHPGVDFDDRIQFNKKVLQFLILHYLWFAGVSGVVWAARPHEVFLASNGSHEYNMETLIQERLVNSAFRQRWRYLCTREKREQRSGARIFTAATLETPSVPIAEDLVIRFLEISEELAYKMNQNSPSVGWINLTTELMFQTTIERLNQACMDLGSIRSDSDWHNLQKFLEECFAWGYLKPDHHTADASKALEFTSQLSGSGDDSVSSKMRKRSILEDRIAETLFATVSDQDEEGDTSMQLTLLQESPDWAKARVESLQQISFVIASIRTAEASEKLIPLEMLKQAHPLLDFASNLLMFVETQWRMVSMNDWQGKPILIQIEEGGIRGMSENDFKIFKERIGTA